MSSSGSTERRWLISKVIKTDRSRIEVYQHCKRRRWHEYHEAGIGIRPKRYPLPLAVGGSVHVGFAHLLENAMGIPMAELWIQKAEDNAVALALEDFGQYASALQVDLSEQVAMGGDPKTIESQLMKSLGQESSDEHIEKLAQIREQSLSSFDQYLFEEQSALVEGLVRAYARRRLKPLLEQFEVLEVEREGMWRLASIGPNGENHTGVGEGYSYPQDTELWFMSRPDALILERSSRNLYILSYKTAASWDIRKDRDATRDMQGLSEGVEIEKRLGEAWKWIKERHAAGEVAYSLNETMQGGISKRVAEFLRDSPAPPRILGIRYEYVLKGDRWLDKELTQELGLDVRAQRSPLVRAYLNPGMASGDEQWNCSWDYVKEGGEVSKLYWKSWRATPVFKHMPIKSWIDALDKSVETIGEEGRVLGWNSPAQSTGYLKTHPLDDIFIPPIVVYRNDDELRDWIEQVEAQEIQIAEHVDLVSHAADDATRRHLLNVYFPQTRRACEYPTTCPFAATPTAPGPCFGSDEAFADPLGTGRYEARKINHPQEEQQNISKKSLTKV